MDEIDRAQAREEQQRADALAEQARRSQTDGVDHEFCTECDDPIPPARRRALPGVQLRRGAAEPTGAGATALRLLPQSGLTANVSEAHLCVECAERIERANKLRGR